MGMKADTRDSKNILEKPVTHQEGSAMAKIVGAFAYVECSSKTREGVDQVFVQAARAINSVPQLSQKRKLKQRQACNIL